MKNMINSWPSKSLIEMTKDEWQKATGEKVDDIATEEIIDAYADLLLYLFEMEQTKEKEVNNNATKQSNHAA